MIRFRTLCISDSSYAYLKITNAVPARIIKSRYGQTEIDAILRAPEVQQIPTFESGGTGRCRTAMLITAVRRLSAVEGRIFFYLLSVLLPVAVSCIWAILAGFDYLGPLRLRPIQPVPAALAVVLLYPLVIVELLIHELTHAALLSSWGRQVDFIYLKFLPIPMASCDMSELFFVRSRAVHFICYFGGFLNWVLLIGIDLCLLSATSFPLFTYLLAMNGLVLAFCVLLSVLPGGQGDLLASLWTLVTRRLNVYE